MLNRFLKLLSPEKTCWPPFPEYDTTYRDVVWVGEKIIVSRLPRRGYWVTQLSCHYVQHYLWISRLYVVQLVFVCMYLGAARHDMKGPTQQQVNQPATDIQHFWQQLRSNLKGEGGALALRSSKSPSLYHLPDDDANRINRHGLASFPTHIRQRINVLFMSQSTIVVIILTNILTRRWCHVLWSFD